MLTCVKNSRGYPINLCVYVIIEVDSCAVQRFVSLFKSFACLNNAMSNSPFLGRDGIIEFTFLEQRIISAKQATEMLCSLALMIMGGKS